MDAVPTIAAVVPRPRVEGRLRSGLERGPVAVIAPAGYGKTAAVAGALEGWGGLSDRVGRAASGEASAARAPVAWHSCGPLDGDAGGLLVAILRALRGVVPGAADVLLERLAEPGATVDPVAVLAALLDELAALLVEPVVLVLDDAERLPGDPATLALLTALLDADPAGVRLVLAARHRPALRLSRRVASGRLELLEEADLRFDAEECAALLHARTGRQPSDAAVAALLEETRGWPLGIALGLTGRDERERRLEQYLVEEVLDALDPARRAALLDSSVEGGLDPDGPVLASAPPDLLETTARLGLAPQGSPADPAGRAWHPLVREALAARWRIERPAAVRAELTAAVARRLQDAGRPADAVDRWLEAGRPDEAVTAIAQAAPDMLRAAPATVRRWLAALPQSAPPTGEIAQSAPHIATRADASAQSAPHTATPADTSAQSAPRAATPLGEIAWLEARLASAEGRIREAAGRWAAALPALDGERRDGALMAIMESVYFLGDLTLAGPVRAELSEPAAHGDRPVALLASAWLGIVRAAHGEVEDGVALAEAAFAQPAGAFARGFDPLLRVFAEVPGGGHDAVRAQLVAQEAGRSGLEFPEWMASIRGFLESDAGNREAAVEHAWRMVERADRADGTRYWRSLGDVQHAWSLAVAGRADGAEVALAPLRDAGFEGWPACWIDAGLALVAAARGERDATREHAARALESGAASPLFLRYLLALDMAWALAAIGDETRALALVEDTLAVLHDRLGDTRARHGIARLRAQRAWLRGDADDLRAAVAAGPDVVRAEWRCLQEPVWDGLEAEVLDPDATVAVVAAAFGGGPETLELASHPVAAVRGAAAEHVAASDHPAAAARLRALGEDADPAVARRARAAAAHRRGGEAPARSFRLLGGFELRQGAWPVDERAWNRPTAARLVRFLLVHGRGPVPQEVIVEALWPERPAGSAKTQLQVAVSRARQVLDPPDTDAARSAIAFADGAYRLALSPHDRVDAEQFDRAAATALARDEGDDRRAALAQAVALWTGPPLPEERYAGWADDWREHLEATHHRVLAALAQAHRAAGDEAGVADAARRLVAYDELDEGAHRMLIEAYARTGRPALALRQFLACRRALVDGLGLEPSAETARLQAAVLAGEPI